MKELLCVKGEILVEQYNNRLPVCRRKDCRAGNSCSRNSCSVMPSSNRDSCPYQGVDRLPLAMAYVPWQKWGDLYEPSKGLMVGTVFKDLDYPFCERSCLNP